MQLAVIMNSIFIVPTIWLIDRITKEKKRLEKEIQELKKIYLW